MNKIIWVLQPGSLLEIYPSVLSNFLGSLSVFEITVTVDTATSDLSDRPLLPPWTHTSVHICVGFFGEHPSHSLQTLQVFSLPAAAHVLELTVSGNHGDQITWCFMLLSGPIRERLFLDDMRGFHGLWFGHVSAELKWLSLVSSQLESFKPSGRLFGWLRSQKSLIHVSICLHIDHRLSGYRSSWLAFRRKESWPFFRWTESAFWDFLTWMFEHTSRQTSPHCWTL